MPTSEDPTSIGVYADTPEAQRVLEDFFDFCERAVPFAYSKILEIGPGAGHSTVSIARRMPGGRIVAIEPDTHHFDQAYERFVRDLGNVTHLEIDLIPTSAQEVSRSLIQFEGFDIFIWANGIHYLETEAEMLRFFEDMKLRCSRGGFFCSAFSKEAVTREARRTQGHMTRAALAVLGVAKEDAPTMHELQAWGSSDYERLAKGAGFENVVIEKVPFKLSAGVYQAIAYDQTYLNNALPPTGALAKFSQAERINALVEGAAKAYQELGVETTERIWLFGRVW